MTDLGIEVVDAVSEPYAAVPTITFKLALSSTVPVHAAVLRAQVRIEPQRRSYSSTEAERLLELFGETPQWGESLHPFVWAHLGTTVQGFTGSTLVDLPMPCSYDFEVAAAKYLHALGDGEVPTVFLFSGTVFAASESGFAAQLVPWDIESRFRLPARVWRATMDRYFPGTGWMRLRHDTLDRLQRYKAVQGLPTYDQALEALLKDADA
ncbi:MAG: DUF6084 family protein [Acidimicrobiales bacterium]